MGGLTKSNNNTVTLRGANSYSGATAVVNGNLVVVTNNMSEFTRIPGLMVENWVEEAQTSQTRLTP